MNKWNQMSNVGESSDRLVSTQLPECTIPALPPVSHEKFGSLLLRILFHVLDILKIWDIPIIGNNG